MARRQQLASPVSEFMGVMMVAAIVLYGGSLVLSKDSGSDLTGPAFIAYIALFSRFFAPPRPSLIRLPAFTRVWLPANAC
jgi:subfamily B ATP-binding cassette protein MsbA